MRTRFPFALATVLVVSASHGPSTETETLVHLVRVPDGGVQPEIALDQNGVAHVVYLAGEPRAANVYYVRSADGGKTLSRPVRVNSQDGSAIAMGTIRGAQIALDGSGRAHVAWNGSDQATPKPPVNPKSNRSGMPMLYSRSNPSGTAFEVQRNLITHTTNLDGGGGIAVDRRAVYVAWHANGADGEGGEEARRVWLARSLDDGATFAQEVPISDATTGVCGCCALRLFTASNGGLHVLYRSATALMNRDMYSLISTDEGRMFVSRRLHPWKLGACPMTSMSVAQSGGRVLRAWETDGQVYFDSSNGADQLNAPPMPPGHEAARRKHPRVAVNNRGAVLLVWTEGTSWGRGGSLAWHAFGDDGRPIGTQGTEADVPVWSFAAAMPRPDGGFTILY